MNYIKISKYDIANGIGIGVVLWVAGCRCNCYNCHNPQTHDFNQGYLFNNNTLNELYDAISKEWITRLTLSGGHPFEKENLPVVLDIVRKCKQRFPYLKIWIYTGYSWEEIINNSQIHDILKYTDILVDGRYIDNKSDISLAWKGSTNQRIIDVQRSLKENTLILMN